jgi:type IV pilus assembly protein PilA
MNAKILRSQKGFTLIELMIVVGIIGILVAIAAPNFSRYQSKARQSEAKIALSAIYAAEKSFFSEYSAYHTNLAAVGYQPEGLKRYYWVGFGNMTTTSVSGFTPAGIASQANYNRIGVPAAWSQCGGAAPTTITAANTPTTASLSTRGYDATPAADPQTFTAGADGQLRQGQTCDSWEINDNKVLNNAVVAL